MRLLLVLFLLSVATPAWAQSATEIATVKKGVQQILKADLPVMSRDQRRFKLESVDLNGDGKFEHFVYFQNNYFCGTGGCSFFLLNHQGQLITRFTVSEAPVIVLTSKTHRWRDLLLTHKGKTYKLRFDGKRYPGNPSVAPAYNLDIKADKVSEVRYLFSETPVPLPLHSF